MIKEGGGVMTINEMEEAGLEQPPYHQETWQTSHGPITVSVQEPGTGAGIFQPETNKIIPFHPEQQERKAA